MHALIWVAIGLVVGWLAGTLTRNRSYGLFSDLLLGVLGGLVGGWVFRVASVTGAGVTAIHAMTALLGALLLIGASRLMRPLGRQTERLLSEAVSVADLETRIRQLGKLERSAIDRLLHRQHALRNPNEKFDEQLTLGQRVADRVAAFGGSWRFIGLFSLFTLGWMIVNTETGLRFDIFPFILLNLLLSCLAALQGPVIMMSQNRQAAKDRLDAQHDYEVNLHAELQIEQLHAKLDDHQQKAWAELMDLQRRQIELLEALVETRRGT